MMWKRLSSNDAALENCDEVCGALERSTPLAPGSQVLSMDAFLVELPEAVRGHILSCETCRTFADDLLEVRGLFAAHADQRKPEPGPYFLTRVMAEIADREAQLERSAQTWAAVPRLASRLTVLASVGLLIAAGWVYQMPKTTTSVSMNSPQASEGLVDTGAVQDDLLVSPAGR